MTDTKSVAIPDITKDEDVLAKIVTLDDALKALSTAGVNATEIKDLGSGFVILENKDQLVGKAMLILGMTFNSSDTYGEGGEFVSLTVVDETNGKWIVNDGSTGIYAQCKRYSEKGITSIICRKGLTRSDYKTDAVNPKTGEVTKIDATTYYLSSV